MCASFSVVGVCRGLCSLRSYAFTHRVFSPPPPPPVTLQCMNSGCGEGAERGGKEQEKECNNFLSSFLFPVMAVTHMRDGGTMRDGEKWRTVGEERGVKSDRVGRGAFLDCE